MKFINQKVNEDISCKRPIKLDLGAGGKSCKEGYYSVDLLALAGVDIVANLNEPLGLLPDDCCDALYSRHTFEHVENLLLLMGEIARICKNGADIEITVPQFANPLAYSDPTHVRYFGLYSMYYFVSENLQPSKTRKVPSFYGNTRFQVQSIYIQFYRSNIIDRLFVPIFRAFVNKSFFTQEFYEKRLSWIFPAWQITYRMVPEKKCDY